MKGTTNEFGQQVGKSCLTQEAILPSQTPLKEIFDKL